MAIIGNNTTNSNSNNRVSNSDSNSLNPNNRNLSNGISNNNVVSNRERATINNANNIRNAADIATASKHPMAMAAGAGVKALDKATGGKSTKALAKIASRTTERMPGGKQVQNALNKVSESGIGNKLSKKNSGLPNNQNNKVGNGPTKASPKNDIGSKNLQKSKFNRAKNMLQARQKKKRIAQETESENTSSDTNSFQTDDLVSKAMRRIRIHIIVSIVAVMIAIVFIVSSFLAIFGINVQFGIPAAGAGSYGTKEFTSTYEEGTKEYDNEINYYKALAKASSNYEKEHGEPLKKNYIHSVLIYVNYEMNIDEENIDESKINEKNEKDVIGIDYEKMTSKIDDIVELMTPSDDKKNIDYEKNGEFYNNLKKSVEFKKYYKNILKNKDIDEVLTEIFDLAENLESITYDDDTVITDDTQVNIGDSAETISMNEYLSGSIYANNLTNNSEQIKAYAVAYTTNLVSNNTLTVNSKIAKASNEICSVKNGCSYDIKGNLVMGPSSKNSKNTILYNGKYYYKKPLTSSEISNLNSDIKSVYGNVLVNSDGTYPNVNINVINGLGDGKYTEILKDAYGNYQIKDVSEDSYIVDGDYGDKKVLTNVIFYDQNDYQNTEFCGIEDEDIKTSGCGTTAMSILISTYENSTKYNPTYIMNRAHTTGYCGTGISGTSPSFFKNEADHMNYKYLRVNKTKKDDLNLVLKHLSQGHLVIAHMKAGHFTSGGHYIVLGGINPDNKNVYVYDPNNASNVKNRDSGNGWYSFNDIIVKESFNYFYIIWKG